MNFTLKQTKKQYQLQANQILKKNNHIGNIQSQSIIQSKIKQNMFTIDNVQQREISRSQKNNDVSIKINNDHINVYIISNNTGGGSIKYLDDIINNAKYKNNFIIIKSENELNQYEYSNSILFVQHLFNTDVKLETLFKIKKTTDVQIIISIHDCYWLHNNISRIFDNTIFWHNAYLTNDITIHESIIQLFKIADEIVCPSNFIYSVYSKYFSTNNFLLVNHNDYFVDYSTKNVPFINNNNINIGVLHESTICKGIEYINYLSDKFIIYKNYKINWYIVGKNVEKYKEGDFFNYIKKLNIHCLTALNKYGETWCYALTKFINSGLPIIYNNVGSFKERIPNKDHYFKVYETESETDINNKKLDDVFIQLLDYTIKHNGKFNNMNASTEIVYNKYYNDLFNNKTNNLNLFAVYFPQFHTIIENDINYYKGYNDIINLKCYLSENPKNPDHLDTPLLSNYDIDDLSGYNLENNNIINKQVDIAQSYGLKGFAIYYYWFSTNTITNSNTIMENGYKEFFNNSYDTFKVYFIWANENWSDNVAFNVDNKNQIINEYNITEFEKNCNHLITYFKHINYYKIDNKPVFSIHHPWFITNEQIDLFFDILNNLCIQNRFDGVNLIINSMGKTYTKYKNYNFHPNYKNPPMDTMYRVDGKNYLDYKKYVNGLHINNNIDTLFFDFNNTARLYKPKNLKFVTKAINNTDEHIDMFIQKIKEKYKFKKYSEIDSIVLINAWNEWGENMSIEPGTKMKYYYLNKVKEFKTKVEA
jgi:hypothetical protein